MNEKQLLELIQKGENENTVFLKDPQVKDVIPEICALANSMGGKIIMGVDPVGNIQGITNDNSDVISVSVATEIQPLPSISIEKFDLSGKKVQLINIPEGREKPYSQRVNNNNIYWVKHDGVRMIASRDNLVQMVLSHNLDSPDAKPVPGTSIVELDLPMLEEKFKFWYQKNLKSEIKEAGIKTENLLESMGVLKNRKLTLAGLMLFGKTPQKFKPDLRCWLVRFKGNDKGKSEINDKKEVDGNISLQLGKSLKFLRSHLDSLLDRHPSSERSEKSSLLVKVFRELMINALAHRDYENDANIRVFIFDDKIRIISPGRLPEGITPDNIFTGVRRERNPLICRFLEKSGLMNRIGTGIPRLAKLCRNASGIQTVFMEREDEFRVVISL